MQKPRGRRLATPLALGALLVVPVAAPATRVHSRAALCPGATECAPPLPLPDGVVHFRAEGAKRTLVRQTLVSLPVHPVGKPGKPTCPGSSGLGALDAATHGRWSGSFSSQYKDYLVQTITGETHSGTPDYFALWINGRMATKGFCSLRPRTGDSILVFVSRSSTNLPLRLSTPARATAKQAFPVRVVKLRPAGGTVPVRGATVSGGGVRVRTGRRGYAQVRTTRPGQLVLRATAPGLIRSEYRTVRVAAAG